MEKTIAEQFEDDWDDKTTNVYSIKNAIERIEARLSALEHPEQPKHISLAEATQLAQKVAVDNEARRNAEREAEARQYEGDKPKGEWIPWDGKFWIGWEKASMGVDLAICKNGHFYTIGGVEYSTPICIMPYIPGEPKPEPPEVK